jgi:hypothetical protein
LATSARCLGGIALNCLMTVCAFMPQMNHYRMSLAGVTHEQTTRSSEVALAGGAYAPSRVLTGALACQSAIQTPGHRPPGSGKSVRDGTFPARTFRSLVGRSCCFALIPEHRRCGP